jgi:hypothetical protein
MLELVRLLLLQGFTRKVVLLGMNGTHRTAFPLFRVTGFSVPFFPKPLQIALKPFEVVSRLTAAQASLRDGQFSSRIRRSTRGTHLSQGAFHLGDCGIECFDERWPSTYRLPRSGLVLVESTDRLQKSLMRAVMRFLDPSVHGGDVFVRVSFPRESFP